MFFFSSQFRQAILEATLFLILSQLALPSSSAAQELISATPDVTIDLGSGVVSADEDVVVDNQLGIVLLENLGALPGASHVIAFDHDVNGDRLLAFDTTTLLTGGLVARKGDIVRFDGAAYAIEFDASLAGVPTAASVDAASLSSNGLLLSFDTTVDLPGGLVAADEDLVEWTGANFSLVLDASSEGVDTSLDIDAVHDLGGSELIVSFDAHGAVDGVDFADEDLLRFDGASFSLELDSSVLNPAWASADLSAVAVPEPGISLSLCVGVYACAWFQRRRVGASIQG